MRETAGSAAAPAARCKKLSARQVHGVSPPGRRTVNTEPLPVSLVAVHVAAHHARALAGDGKAELGAAVSPRDRARPPTLTSTSMLSRTAARARVRPLSRVR